MAKVTVETQDWVSQKERSRAFEIAFMALDLLRESRANEMLRVEIIKITWGKELTGRYSEFLIVLNPTLHKRIKINVIARFDLAGKEVSVCINDTSNCFGSIHLLENNQECRAYAILEAMRVGITWARYLLMKDVTAFDMMNRVLFPFAQGKSQVFYPMYDSVAFPEFESFVIENPLAEEEVNITIG